MLEAGVPTFPDTHKPCGMKSWCKGSRTVERGDRKTPDVIEQVYIEIGWFEKV